MTQTEAEKPCKRVSSPIIKFQIGNASEAPLLGLKSNIFMMKTEGGIAYLNTAGRKGFREEITARSRKIKKQ